MYHAYGYEKYNLQVKYHSWINCHYFSSTTISQLQFFQLHYKHSHSA